MCVNFLVPGTIAPSVVNRQGWWKWSKFSRVSKNPAGLDCRFPFYLKTPSFTQVVAIECVVFVGLLFSPLGKLAGRAIYFTFRSFYPFLSSFLMISWRQIISRSAGPIFAIFTSNESFLGVDGRSGPLFSISQGTLPWQPILCKNGAKLPTLPALIALSFRNNMG